MNIHIRKGIIFTMLIMLPLTFSFCTSEKHTVMRNDPSALEGTWELTYLRSRIQTPEELFPSKLPQMTFDTKLSVVSGYSGCNTFSGTYLASDDVLEFRVSAVTEKLCIDGMEGEKLLLQTLEKVDAYSFTNNNTLKLFRQGQTVIRMKRVSN